MTLGGHTTFKVWLEGFGGEVVKLDLFSWASYWQIVEDMTSM